jgi:hypothetical protein
MDVGPWSLAAKWGLLGAHTVNEKEHQPCAQQSEIGSSFGAAT